jgi:FixJ family two-component response regulator
MTTEFAGSSAAAFIEKPFSPQRLTAAVRSALEGR